MSLHAIEIFVKHVALHGQIGRTVGTWNTRGDSQRLVRTILSSTGQCLRRRAVTLKGFSYPNELLSVDTAREDVEEE